MSHPLSFCINARVKYSGKTQFCLSNLVVYIFLCGLPTNRARLSKSVYLLILVILGCFVSFSRWPEISISFWKSSMKLLSLVLLGVCSTSQLSDLWRIDLLQCVSQPQLQDNLFCWYPMLTTESFCGSVHSFQRSGGHVRQVYKGNIQQF